jgi:hypothetical protein
MIAGEIVITLLAVAAGLIFAAGAAFVVGAVLGLGFAALDFALLKLAELLDG